MFLLFHPFLLPCHLLQFLLLGQPLKHFYSKILLEIFFLLSLFLLHLSLLPRRFLQKLLELLFLPLFLLIPLLKLLLLLELIVIHSHLLKSLQLLFSLLLSRPHSLINRFLFLLLLCQLQFSPLVPLVVSALVPCYFLQLLLL